MCGEYEDAFWVLVSFKLLGDAFFLSRMWTSYSSTPSFLRTTFVMKGLLPVKKTRHRHCLSKY